MTKFWRSPIVLPVLFLFVVSLGCAGDDGTQALGEELLLVLESLELDDASGPDEVTSKREVYWTASGTFSGSSERAIEQIRAELLAMSWELKSEQSGAVDSLILRKQETYLQVGVFEPIADNAERDQTSVVQLQLAAESDSLEWAH